MKPDPADILDRCIEELRAGGDPERILAEHPDVAEEVRPLLALARRLEGLPEQGGSTGGLVRALTRAAAEADREREHERRRHVRLFSRPVLARVAAALLLVLAVGWGATAASAGTVPGDLLYPLKRATEKVSYFLTLNAQDQAQLRLTFSEKRLAEAVKMQAEGRPIDTQLLESMLDDAKEALQAGQHLPPQTQALLVSQAGHLAGHQEDALKNIEQRAPESQRPAIQPYMMRCRRRCAWMGQAPTSEDETPAGRSGQAPPQRRARRWRGWMMNCPR